MNIIEAAFALEAGKIVKTPDGRRATALGPISVFTGEGEDLSLNYHDLLSEMWEIVE